VGYLVPSNPRLQRTRLRAPLSRKALGVRRSSQGAGLPRLLQLGSGRPRAQIVEASPVSKPGALDIGRRWVVKQQGVSWCRSLPLYERHAQPGASADSLRSAALAAEL
jgi:hypothetical protein